MNYTQLQHASRLSLKSWTYVPTLNFSVFFNSASILHKNPVRLTGSKVLTERNFFSWMWGSSDSPTSQTSSTPSVPSSLHLFCPLPGSEISVAAWWLVSNVAVKCRTLSKLSWMWKLKISQTGASKHTHATSLGTPGLSSIQDAGAHSKGTFKHPTLRLQTGRIHLTI